MNSGIKPSYVLWTTLATLAILGLVSAFLPYFPIETERFSIRLPHPRSILGHDSVNYTNIDTLVASVLEEIDIQPVVEVEPFPDSTLVVDSIVADSIKPLISEKTPVQHDTIRATESKIRSKVHKLQFPPDRPDLISVFYAALRSESKKRNVRVLHYGDSQIEGDRITGYLRHRFQGRFGGSGPGLLLCDKPVAEHATIVQSASDDWQRDNVMQKTDTVTNAIGYGIMGQTNHFATQYPQQAWLSYRLSPMSYPTARKYNWCRLFLGYSQHPLDIEVFGRDSLIMKDQIVLDEPLNVFGFQIDKTPDNIVFKFASEQSPSFYALTLDQSAGVTVDNIPWRGSSGAEFSKIDHELLGYFFRQLNVRLIIFQFGVNIVPNVVKGYNWYEEVLVRQLQHLRRAAGDTPVIVIGVSDMSRKRDTWYESYPNIPAIRNAQRNAAFRTGCAFWDLYEAMGGQNSMPSWVFAKPSLANKDFVHFNARGSRIVSHMLYEAIMNGYE
jgi:lysophospholipase L1-like esterase